jgi:hypothetical protein
VLVDDHATPQRGRLAGSTEQVAEKLAEFVAHGFTCFLFWLSDDADDQLERLARQVIPFVRADRTSGFCAMTKPCAGNRQIPDCHPRDGC